jgi:hypothetical protein
LCCSKPCVRYRQRLFRRHGCGDCGPAVTTLLRVIDPCRCCAVEVPVCLPACCQDAPSVCSRRGLLGRRVVDYTWCSDQVIQSTPDLLRRPVFGVNQSTNPSDGHVAVSNGSRLPNCRSVTAPVGFRPTNTSRWRTP